MYDLYFSHHDALMFNAPLSLSLIQHIAPDSESSPSQNPGDLSSAMYVILFRKKRLQSRNNRKSAYD